ncbi:hypothetical protein SKAU_G00286220 [Synaphobranchus kaupii]|uniref:Reverse transcriptase zinc-binding domain-containing protein n=1 Tax=Synaphobranchus kaupii TaxID=118154 RepID=A0A9Q1EY16_SYNKA|nr:hypothetical protein SKAU_G00286220 [Synaphobranchus kaupii]
MVGLRGLDGKIQTGAVEMVGVATEFYRGLFENRVVEEGVGKRFLGLVEERVPEEVRAALEAPFNLEELRKALGGMKEKGLEVALDEVKDFSRGSGGQLNVGKSKIKFFGKWRSRTDVVCGISLCEGPLRMLGVDFGGDAKEDGMSNWKWRVAAVSRRLSLWSVRRLTISGKVLAFKADVLPSFLVGWDNKAPKAERVPAHLLWVVRWARRHEECADRDLVVDHRRLYKALREKLRPVGGLGVGVGRGVWAAVQPKGLDNRLKDLNWLIAYGRLPVRDVLYRHSLTQDRFCPRAGCRERETVQHVFWGCAFAQEVWGLVKGRYGVLEGLRQEGVIFGEGLGKKKGRDKFLAMLLMSVVKYKLWVARGEKGEVKQGWTTRAVFQMVKGDVERRYGWEVLRWGFHAAWERWKALM